MVRRDLLIGKIKANGMTYIKIADRLGVTPRTVLNKMKRGDFLCSEAEEISDMLGLTNEEVLNIFFTKKVT